MQGTKITKERIQNHFAYSWWKYALLAIVAIFGWNLIYTTSAYKAPKDKRLDMTFVTYAISDEITSMFQAEILARYPEEQVEDSLVSSIVYTTEDNYYGSMQLMAYMGAAEGDIYVVTRERFDVFAQDGAFMPLDEMIADGRLDLHGLDVSRGIASYEEGGKAVYGIPMTELYGFMEYGIDNRDLMLCLMAYSQNEDVAADWMGHLIEEMHQEKPQWLVDQEMTSTTHMETSEIPSY